MNIAGYRLPLFSSLILWAIIWEIAGHTGAKLILPPLSVSLTELDRICEALEGGIEFVTGAGPAA